MKIKKTKRARFYLNKAIIFAIESNKLRMKQYALLEISLSYFKDNDVHKFEKIIGALENEIQIQDGNDVLLIGGRILTIGKSYIEKDTQKALFILGEAYRFLISIPPSSELLECCKLLRECNIIIKAPYNVDFYQIEIKRLAKEVKTVKSRTLG